MYNFFALILFSYWIYLFSFARTFSLAPCVAQFLFRWYSCNVQYIYILKLQINFCPVYKNTVILHSMPDLWTEKTKRNGKCRNCIAFNEERKIFLRSWNWIFFLLFFWCCCCCNFHCSKCQMQDLVYIALRIAQHAYKNAIQQSYKNLLLNWK